MKKTLGMVLLAMVVLVTAMSCNRSARIIPNKTMQKIYFEMFLADQWLYDQPGASVKADTTLFYEPIFEKYGYHHADYLATVDHLLEDPSRYTLLLSKVSTALQAEADRINRDIARKEELQHKADSIAALLESRKPEDVFLFESLFLSPLRMDTISMIRMENGALLPERLLPDTLYDGPAFSLRDSIAKDSVVVDIDTIVKPFLQLDEPLSPMEAVAEEAVEESPVKEPFRPRVKAKQVEKEVSETEKPKRWLNRKKEKES